MEDWKISVCNKASTVSIADINAYISIPNLNQSPIDRFYHRQEEILRVCTPAFASANPNITPLLLVGLISLIENYYRDIISEMIKLCPISKESSSEKSINLASIWFGYNNLEKGALENISFSDSKNISKNLKTIFNLDVENANNQINAPLEQFSKLCELRHAIVHSAGELSGKNAIKLQLPNSRSSVQVILNYSELQESAAICSSLVCASNLELFKLMTERWLHRWPSTPAYSGKNLNKIFGELWKTFFSENDKSKGLISNNMTMVKARNAVIRTRAT